MEPTEPGEPVDAFIILPVAKEPPRLRTQWVTPAAPTVWHRTPSWFRWVEEWSATYLFQHAHRAESRLRMVDQACLHRRRRAGTPLVRDHYTVFPCRVLEEDDPGMPLEAIPVHALFPPGSSHSWTSLPIYKVEETAQRHLRLKYPRHQVRSVALCLPY